MVEKIELPPFVPTPLTTSGATAPPVPTVIPYDCAVTPKPVAVLYPPAPPPPPFAPAALVPAPPPPATTRYSTLNYNDTSFLYRFLHICFLLGHWLV